MPVVLVVFAALAALGGLAGFAGPTVIHEIAGLVCWLIAAVLLVGAAVTARIRAEAQYLSRVIASSGGALRHAPAATPVAAWPAVRPMAQPDPDGEAFRSWCKDHLSE